MERELLINGRGEMTGAKELCEGSRLPSGAHHLLSRQTSTVSLSSCVT